MITDKVLGAYAAVGKLDLDEQASWYSRAMADWGLNTFEIPLFAGVPLAPELADTFAANSSSLVVTLVAQWATKGQENPAYGLASLDEEARQEALLDVQSVIQQCQTLSRRGIGIRALEVHTGQGSGKAIPHAISFFSSLCEVSEVLSVALPDAELTVEIADNREPDYAITFPGAKKACLTRKQVMETVEMVNNVEVGGQPVSVVLNWGRLLVNGDEPHVVLGEVLDSPVPLGGVILSGAGNTSDGFADSHNTHLDPDSGFTLDDARRCAETVGAGADASFIGMKGSTNSAAALTAEEVLVAEAEFLNSV